MYGSTAALVPVAMVGVVLWIARRGTRRNARPVSAQAQRAPRASAQPA